MAGTNNDAISITDIEKYYQQKMLKSLGELKRTICIKLFDNKA